MTTVMIFGTFDLLHPGHEFVFREAKKLGETLVIVIARDDTVRKLKGFSPHDSEKIRKQKIRALGIADKVILGNKRDHLAAVKKYRPDVIALGYDQGFFADTLKKDLEKIGLRKVRIKRLPAHQPHKYKTSLMKKFQSSKL